MELLINKTDVEKYFQIAIGRKESEFNKFILQAQQFDLKKLLPERFFFDILKNRDSEKYQKIIEPTEYTYEDGDYEHAGLKGVLVHLTYGLYIFKGGILDSSFGHVVKNNGQSDPVDYKERRDWLNEYRAQAGQIWEDIKRFIDRNIDDYPAYTDRETIREHKTFKTKLIQ